MDRLRVPIVTDYVNKLVRQVVAGYRSAPALSLTQAAIHAQWALALEFCGAGPIISTP